MPPQVCNSWVGCISSGDRAELKPQGHLGVLCLLVLDSYTRYHRLMGILASAVLGVLFLGLSQGIAPFS